MKKWTQWERDVLLKYYTEYGSHHCANILGRSPKSIAHQVSKLNLTTIIVPWGLPQKPIIRKLNDNKAISICKKHGETPHYFRRGKLFGCILCQAKQMKALNQTDRMKKYYRNKSRKDRQTKIGLYKSRLRNLLNNAYRRHLSKSGVVKRRGCFRYLPYSPIQLKDHLEKIRESQQNKCPICDASYDLVGFNIDHIVPLATGRVEKEILELFNISNLSLLCPGCNRAKGDRQDWIKEKCCNE